MHFTDRCPLIGLMVSATALEQPSLVHCLFAWFFVCVCVCVVIVGSLFSGISIPYNLWCHRRSTLDMPNFSVIRNVTAMLVEGSRRVLMMTVALPVKCSPFRAVHWDGNRHHEQVP